MRSLTIALLVAGCGAAPTAPSASHAADAHIRHDTADLAHRSLTGSSLPALQLLATEDGRALFGHVVACALPHGASITTLDRTGVPHSFAGNAGLAPGWAQHAPSARERQRVTSCVLVATSGTVRA